MFGLHKNKIYFFNWSMGAWLSSLFGGEKEPSKHDKAVWDLKVQRDKLVQYKKKINSVIEKEIQVAQELLKQKKKDKAKLALQKKKYQEQLLEKAEAQMDNIKKLVKIENFNFRLMILNLQKSKKKFLMDLKKVQKHFKLLTMK